MMNKPQQPSLLRFISGVSHYTISTKWSEREPKIPPKSTSYVHMITLYNTQQFPIKITVSPKFLNNENLLDEFFWTFSLERNVPSDKNKEKTFCLSIWNQLFSELIIQTSLTSKDQTGGFSQSSSGSYVKNKNIAQATSQLQTRKYTSLNQNQKKGRGITKYELVFELNLDIPTEVSIAQEQQYILNIDIFLSLDRVFQVVRDVYSKNPNVDLMHSGSSQIWSSGGLEDVKKSEENEIVELLDLARDPNYSNNNASGPSTTSVSGQQNAPKARPTSQQLFGIINLEKEKFNKEIFEFFNKANKREQELFPELLLLFNVRKWVTVKQALRISSKAKVASSMCVYFEISLENNLSEHPIQIHELNLLFSETHKLPSVNSKSSSSSSGMQQTRRHSTIHSFVNTILQSKELKLLQNESFSPKIIGSSASSFPFVLKPFEKATILLKIEQNHEIQQIFSESAEKKKFHSFFNLLTPFQVIFSTSLDLDLGVKKDLPAIPSSSPDNQQNSQIAEQNNPDKEKEKTKSQPQPVLLEKYGTIQWVGLNSRGVFVSFEMVSEFLDQPPENWNAIVANRPFKLKMTISNQISSPKEKIIENLNISFVPRMESQKSSSLSATKDDQYNLGPSVICEECEIFVGSLHPSESKDFFLTLTCLREGFNLWKDLTILDLSQPTAPAIFSFPFPLIFYAEPQPNKATNFNEIDK